MFKYDDKGELILPKMPKSDTNEEDNIAFNKSRTYDHLHKDMPLGYPHYSDKDIAHMTRMLFRDDWHFEGMVSEARNRILCLLKENEELKRKLNVRSETNGND